MGQSLIAGKNVFFCQMFGASQESTVLSADLNIMAQPKT